MQELSHLEQLETRSEPDRHPRAGSSRPRISASCRATSIRTCPTTRAGTRSTSCRASRSTTAPIVLAGRERLRAKLSYTNVGFALAPAEFTISELRDLYLAALGHDVSATNLQRVLLRRRLLVPTGSRRKPGPSGGRPAALFGFRPASSRSPISSRSCDRLAERMPTLNAMGWQDGTLRHTTSELALIGRDVQPVIHEIRTDPVVGAPVRRAWVSWQARAVPAPENSCSAPRSNPAENRMPARKRGRIFGGYAATSR